MRSTSHIGHRTNSECLLTAFNKQQKIGRAHDIAVLEAYMDSSTGYYAGRRQLKARQDNNNDAASPVPVPTDGDGNTRKEHSFYGLIDEVAEMRKEMVALKARIVELEQTM